MNIIDMTANFGRLSSESLSLTEGLNIIYLPNEGGKSTWCAFMRAMLYGVPSSQRERAGVKPEKIKYAPWDGSPMEGEMNIEDKGRLITLRRGSRPSKPFSEFEAVYTGTANRVPGMNGGSVGFDLTGVSREVFERSAFISGGSGISSSPELERRVAAIVSTGEESGSYSEAYETLRSWQRRRRWRLHGVLPELELQISAAEAELHSFSGEFEKYEKLLAEVEQKRQVCISLARDLDERRESEQRNAVSRLSGLTSEIAAGNEKLKALECELAECERELKSGVFAAVVPETLLHTVAEDSKRARSIEERMASKTLPILAIVLLALGIASFCFSFVSWGFIIAGAALVISSAVLFIRYLSTRDGNMAEQTELQIILRKYNVKSSAEIDELFTKYEACFKRMLGAEREKAQTVEQISMLRSRLANLENELSFGEGIDKELRGMSQLRRELAAEEAELSALREDCARIEGRFGALGDPVVYNTLLQNKKVRHMELSLQYEALQIAIETLADADDELQTRFSPHLAKRAAGYLSKLTGGRYNEMQISKDMAAMVRGADDIAPRETDFLSSGTVDQAYLALRLAICELALPEDRKTPLILDDALINFDSKRSTAALRLFREMAKTRQVILFTCRKPR